MFIHIYIYIHIFLIHDALEEGHKHHELFRVHIGGVEVHKLVHEVRGIIVHEPDVELAHGGQGPLRHLGWVPPCGFGYEVRPSHLRVGAAQLEDEGFDGLEELDLVGALVFLLVLVPPEADVHLVYLGHRFWEDPPLMATHHHIF
jgi:hypothetical protein